MRLRMPIGGGGAARGADNGNRKRLAWSLGCSHGQRSRAKWGHGSSVEATGPYFRGGPTSPKPPQIGSAWSGSATRGLGSSCPAPSYEFAWKPRAGPRSTACPPLLGLSSPHPTRPTQGPGARLLRDLGALGRGAGERRRRGVGSGPLPLKVHLWAARARPEAPETLARSFRHALRARIWAALGRRSLLFAGAAPLNTPIRPPFG